MRRTLPIALSLFLSMPALAEEPTPDGMIARGHFARGAAAYEEKRYADALREFEAAHAAEPLSALDFNIAKCLDMLGRRAGAIATYERYLGVAAGAENAKEVRARLGILRHELAEEVRPTPPAVLRSSPQRAPRTRRWIAPGVVGGGALLFATVGAGLLGSVAANYSTLSGGCSPNCMPSSWASLPVREHAGEAILGLAAAVAVVDVVLIIRATRRK